MSTPIMFGSEQRVRRSTQVPCLAWPNTDGCGSRGSSSKPSSTSRSPSSSTSLRMALAHQNNLYTSNHFGHHLGYLDLLRPAAKPTQVRDSAPAQKRWLAAGGPRVGQAAYVGRLSLRVSEAFRSPLLSTLTSAGKEAMVLKLRELFVPGTWAPTPCLVATVESGPHILSRRPFSKRSHPSKPLFARDAEAADHWPPQSRCAPDRLTGKGYVPAIWWTMASPHKARIRPGVATSPRTPNRCASSFSERLAPFRSQNRWREGAQEHIRLRVR